MTQGRVQSQDGLLLQALSYGDCYCRAPGFAEDESEGGGIRKFPGPLPTQRGIKHTSIMALLTVLITPGYA